MRELSIVEVNEVSGAGVAEDLGEWAHETWNRVKQDIHDVLWPHPHKHIGE